MNSCWKFTILHKCLKAKPDEAWHRQGHSKVHVHTSRRGDWECVYEAYHTTCNDMCKEIAVCCCVCMIF